MLPWGKNMISSACKHNALEKYLGKQYRTLRNEKFGDLYRLPTIVRTMIAQSV
jgi:hypothetical protein